MNPGIGSYSYNIRKCLWDLLHTVEDYKIVSFVYTQLADVLGFEVRIDLLFFGAFFYFRKMCDCLELVIIEKHLTI